MPKVSIYLPDDLYRRARDRDLPISTLAQRAIEQALRGDSRQRWIDAAKRRPSRASRLVDVAALVDEVRDELGS